MLFEAGAGFIFQSNNFDLDWNIDKNRKKWDIQIKTSGIMLTELSNYPNTSTSIRCQNRRQFLEAFGIDIIWALASSR